VSLSVRRHWCGRAGDRHLLADASLETDIPGRFQIVGSLCDRDCATPARRPCRYVIALAAAISPLAAIGSMIEDGTSGVTRWHLDGETELG
jgi:hypothetical protein